MNYRFAVFLYVLLIFLSVSSCSKEEPAEQKTGKQVPVAAEAPAPATSEAEEGAKIFTKYCQVCHGEGGKGDICPDLTDKEWIYGNSDEQLFQAISGGRPGGMPDWGTRLSQKQIRDAIAYIRSIGVE
jgi:cytochrome c oxidase cbb3-type subunit 3